MALTRRARDGTFTRITELGSQEDGNMYRYDGCATHVYILLAKWRFALNRAVS